jgi:hypothetical protein
MEIRATLRVLMGWLPTSVNLAKICVDPVSSFSLKKKF